MAKPTLQKYIVVFIDFGKDGCFERNKKHKMIRAKTIDEAQKQAFKRFRGNLIVYTIRDYGMMKFREQLT